PPARSRRHAARLLGRRRRPLGGGGGRVRTAGSRSHEAPDRPRRDPTLVLGRSGPTPPRAREHARRLAAHRRVRPRAHGRRGRRAGGGDRPRLRRTSARRDAPLPRHRREPRAPPAPGDPARARDQRRCLPAARQDRAPRPWALLRRRPDRGRVRRRQARGDRLSSRPPGARRAARGGVDGGRSPRVRRGRCPTAGIARRVDRSGWPRPPGGKPSPPPPGRPFAARVGRSPGLSPAPPQRRVGVRALALPAQPDSGGGSEGAVEAPFDDLAAAPTPVQHLAPAPVVVTARLGATRVSDFELVESTVPVTGEGELVGRTIYLSLDPYMRGRMNDVKSYAQPVELGKPMVGGAVSEVIASNHTAFPTGSFVVGPTG